MKKTDVLVIGGGLAGCATAYYLAREGVAVTLVERGELNGRASGANAGSLHVQIPHAEFVGLGEGWARAFAPTLPLLLESVHMWTGLSEELGDDLEVSLTGGLLVAATEAQLRLVEAKAAMERGHGIEIELLDRAGLRERAPYVSGRMIGGAWCPAEGKANPLKATPAFARGAHRCGAVILGGIEVLGLEEEPGGWRAATAAGPIRARRVIDAAGADAGHIAAMAGLVLPIQGFPLQVAVTEPIAPLVPHLLYSAAGKLTLKQMRNGTCLIGGGWPSRVRPGGHLAADPRSLAANMGTALDAVPALANARIARTWPAVVNGTPDWKPIIREAPGRPGLFLTMFPWMGFTAGPIAARMTADLVLGRRSS